MTRDNIRMCATGETIRWSPSLETTATTTTEIPGGYSNFRGLFKIQLRCLNGDDPRASHGATTQYLFNSAPPLQSASNLYIFHQSRDTVNFWMTALKLSPFVRLGEGWRRFSQPPQHLSQDQIQPDQTYPSPLPYPVPTNPTS